MDIVEYYKRKEKEKHKDCIPKSELRKLVDSRKKDLCDSECQRCEEAVVWIEHIEKLLGDEL